MASLRLLKQSLEAMPRAHQIEVLRLLRDGGATDISENCNGTFVNLTCQSDELIASLETYATYVADQQKTLSSVEQEKDRLQKTFFNGNKANKPVGQEEV
jgi:hypothetical protein